MPTLDRPTRELTILNDIAQALNRSVDLDAALRSTLALVGELFGLETGWVWLLNEAGDSYLAAAQNLPPALAQNPAKMEGSCYCLDTFRDGDLAGAANVNVVTCSRLWGLVDGTDGLRYHASVPLYAPEDFAQAESSRTAVARAEPSRTPAARAENDKKKLGVMNVASATWRELSEDDLRLLHTVGDLLSIAVERARLFDSSRELGALTERNRLAREIHDTLAQGLSAIALQLETADALLDGDGEPNGQPDGQRNRIHRAVRSALDLARSNLDEARRSVLDLRAAPLANGTLVEALRQLAREVEQQGGGHVTLETVGAQRPLTVAVETGLYRIAQEALTNAQQHARAAHVTLRLAATPKEVTLRIKDDGRGFDVERVQPNRYGLVGLRERAHLLDGTLTVESEVGVGTVVRARVPLRG